MKKFTVKKIKMVYASQNSNKEYLFYINNCKIQFK